MSSFIERMQDMRSHLIFISYRIENGNGEPNYKAENNPKKTFNYYVILLVGFNYTE